MEFSGCTAARLRAFIAKRGIEPEYSNGIRPAQGVSSGGRITLLPGLSPAEELSVLAHEVAHEMLHASTSLGISWLRISAPSTSSMRPSRSAAGMKTRCGQPPPAAGIGQSCKEGAAQRSGVVLGKEAVRLTEGLECRRAAIHPVREIPPNVRRDESTAA